jgi:uncharacterized protein (TIGR02611 family)
MRKMTPKNAYDLDQVKRLVVFVAGIIALLLGIAMLVAPGPGILTISLGLGILATEFIWARRLLKRLRQKGTIITHRLLRKLAAISSSIRGRIRRGREAQHYRPLAVRKRGGPNPGSYPTRSKQILRACYKGFCKRYVRR